MPQPNDLSRSPIALNQDGTLIAIIEMSQASWLVAGIVPGIARHPLKKLAADAAALLGLLERWRGEATQAGRQITRIVVAFEAGRDGFWLARWLRACCPVACEAGAWQLVCPAAWTKTSSTTPSWSTAGHSQCFLPPIIRHTSSKAICLQDRAAARGSGWRTLGRIYAPTGARFHGSRRGRGPPALSTIRRLSGKRK